MLRKKKVNLFQLKILLSEKVGCSKNEANIIIKSLSDIILAALLENKSVSLGMLGVMQLMHKNDKRGINPVTKAPIIIPAHNVVKFKEFAKVRALINS